MTTALPFRPSPLVLTAPSGTGKTTIAHALVERFSDFVFSVSATTRSPREGEVDGSHYEFVSRDRFEEMVQKEELVEWAEVHGNLYGTPRKNLEKAAREGGHVVLDIDVQGARQIRERVPEAIQVFIFPPSADALWERLRARASEGVEEVRRRLQAARDELEDASQFHYVVVNDDLDSAVARVRALVEAENHRSARIVDLQRRVHRLQEEIDRTLTHQAGG